MQLLWLRLVAFFASKISDLRLVSETFWTHLIQRERSRWKRLCSWPGYPDGSSGRRRRRNQRSQGISVYEQSKGDAVEGDPHVVGNIGQQGNQALGLGDDCSPGALFENDFVAFFLNQDFQRVPFIGVPRHHPDPVTGSTRSHDFGFEGAIAAAGKYG